MSKVFEALAALAAVGTFIVTFLDSYEIKFRIRRRARTVRDEGRRGRRSKKIRPGLQPRPLNLKTASPA